MRWDDLPIELRVIILSLRHEIRTTAISKIQKRWNLFIAPSIAAIDISLSLDIDENGSAIILLNHTPKLLEFLLKILNGKHHREYWIEYLCFLKLGLDEDESHEGMNYNYNSSLAAYNSLISLFTR